jgi:hypothetical protein
MKNLHKILGETDTINFWTDKEGTQIAFHDLPTRHMSAIIERFSARYLKGTLRGERKEMFEGVVREWARRFGAWTDHFG